MTKIETLRDLFIEQTKELYNSSQQELKELPGIEKHATSDSLKKFIDKETRITENQQLRLKKALSNINASTEGIKCTSTETIIDNAKQLIKNSKSPGVRDAVIITSLQQIGHRKVSGLGSLAAYAREIGEVNAAEELHESVQEEKRMGEELISLAKSDINKKAAKAVAG